MRNQVTAKSEEEKPFQYKDQAAAEKGAREAKKKMHEATTKVAELEKVVANLSAMKHDTTKAIVASNLVIASAIISAGLKTQAGDSTKLTDAIQKLLRPLNLASLH